MKVHKKYIYYYKFESKLLLITNTKKGREEPEEGSKLSSKSANGLRQKVQKTGIFELFWPLMSIWRMRNELHKYKQLLRYQGSRVLQ